MYFPVLNSFLLLSAVFVYTFNEHWHLTESAIFTCQESIRPRPSTTPPQPTHVAWKKTYKNLFRTIWNIRQFRKLRYQCGMARCFSRSIIIGDLFPGRSFLNGAFISFLRPTRAKHAKCLSIIQSCGKKIIFDTLFSIFFPIRFCCFNFLQW